MSANEDKIVKTTGEEDVVDPGMCCFSEIEIDSPEDLNKSDPGDSGTTIPQKCQGQSPTMSKNQLRKLMKREKWMKFRPEKRANERAKKKERKQKALVLGIDMGPSRKKLKANTMKTSTCKVKVVIDCSFDDLMAEKDVMQLVQQIGHCYAANRRAVNPMQMYVCSLGGKTRARLDAIGDYKGWDVYFHEEDYVSMLDKSSIVYLTSDSPNILDTLEDNKAYIIGGLVDHNHQKGLCLQLAEEKGIQHAQLPIAAYLDMKTRKVLTINHVYEILLQFTESKNWEDAFFKVLPKRKGAVIKPGDKGSDEMKASENEVLETKETSKFSNPNTCTKVRDNDDHDELLELGTNSNGKKSSEIKDHGIKASKSGAGSLDEVHVYIKDDVLSTNADDLDEQKKSEKQERKSDNSEQDGKSLETVQPQENLIFDRVKTNKQETDSTEGLCMKASS